jgi:hypothetical protein
MSTYRQVEVQTGSHGNAGYFYVYDPVTREQLGTYRQHTHGLQMVAKYHAGRKYNCRAIYHTSFDLSIANGWRF